MGSPPRRTVRRRSALPALRRVAACALLWWAGGAEGQGERDTWWRVGGKPMWLTREDGTLELPSSVREVILDVGVHAETQFFMHAAQSQELMVLGFEPLRRYAEYHRFHPRVLIVPAAVGLTEGPRGSKRRKLLTMKGGLSTFSSLHNFSQFAKTEPLPGGLYLGNAQRPVFVEVVSMEEVLRRIPPDVHVRMLKVDAQGSDLEVVESAGVRLRRVARVQVECQDLPPGHKDLLYVGQPTKRDFIEPFRKAGFVLERCWGNNPLLREENCIFARSDLALDLLGDCFRPRRAVFMPAIPSLRELKAEWEALPGVYDGPRHIVLANEAVLLEQFCCGKPSGGPAQACFDDHFTYERCCLRAYFEAIDHLRDWASFQLEPVISHNSTKAYLVLHP